MAAKVYRLGDRAGNGSKVKIINQLLAGVHIAAAAEAMALGLREGVDPAALYEVITHSAGNSWMFENRMAHVLAGDYTPLSAVDIFVKDLGLVLDTARATKFPLPLASTAHQMFMQASTAGFAKEDDSGGDQDLSRASSCRRPPPDRPYHRTMPRFAANLSMLYPELDFLDRFEAAARMASPPWSICSPTPTSRASWPRGWPPTACSRCCSTARPATGSAASAAWPACPGARPSSATAS